MYVSNLSKIFTGIITFFDLDINNVGSMSQSLYAHNNPEYDEAQALRWQAAQVSAISLTNFGGRILIGTALHIALLPFCLTFSPLTRLLFGLC
jgi:hypothetical protein